jgi:hypothetical protein
LFFVVARVLIAPEVRVAIQGASTSSSRSHVHAFVFLVAALAAPRRLYEAVAIPAAVYLALAMRRVFAGRAWPLMLRFLCVALAYSVLVLLVALAIVLYAVVL